MVMHIYNEHIHVAREWLASASHSTSLHHSDFPCKINVVGVPITLIITVLNSFTQVLYVHTEVCHIYGSNVFCICIISYFLSQCMGRSKRPIECYEKYIQGVIDRIITLSGFGVRRLACIRAFY